MFIVYLDEGVTMLADIVVGVQAGDEAKGKVTHHLCKNGNYTHVLRFNGGCNAGHTIYHEGKKFVTHHIPAGVFHGIKSIIGSGCVVNVEQFFKELEEIKEGGIEVDGKVFIARNAHIITNEHLEQDGRDSCIGTTKRGNGPAYRDKYNRTGVLAEHHHDLKPFLIDLYEELHESGKNIKILFEGAQGFGLDIAKRFLNSGAKVVIWDTDSKMLENAINDIKTKTFQWKPAEEHPEEWKSWFEDPDTGEKKYDDINTDIVMHGLIAQDVKQAMDDVGNTTFQGWKEEPSNGKQHVAREMFVIPLIKAVQELSEQNKALEKRIEELEK